MGYSLRKLRGDVDEPAGALDAMEEVAYATAFAFAVAAWKLPVRDAVATYLFAWIENQVLAAVKGVPLGQTDGQRLLLTPGERIAPPLGHAFPPQERRRAHFAPGAPVSLAAPRH